MHKKHIFVARKDDIFTIYGNLTGEKPVQWAVPESAEVGDQGFFLLPEGVGFCALGEVVSPKEWDGNKWTGWGAPVRIICPFDTNILLKSVQTKFPDWVDVQHPRVWDCSRKINVDSIDYLDFYNFLRYEQKDMGRALAQVIK